MASKRELTVILDEDLFEWAALAAKRQAHSLSDYIAGILSEQREKGIAERLAVLNEFLEGPGWPGIAENLPKRDELYDRPALRRQDPPDDPTRKT